MHVPPEPQLIPWKQVVAASARATMVLRTRTITLAHGAIRPQPAWRRLLCSSCCTFDGSTVDSNRDKHGASGVNAVVVQRKRW